MLTGPPPKFHGTWDILVNASVYPSAVDPLLQSETL